MSDVLSEIAAERARQDEKWGEQNHPDGTGPRVPFAGRLCYMEDAARDARRRCKANTPDRDNWADILLEEVFEAMAEDDPAALRAELVQVAAVAVAWIQAIDRRWKPGTRCNTCRSDDTYLNDDGHPACRGCGASDDDDD